MRRAGSVLFLVVALIGVHSASRAAEPATAKTWYAATIAQSDTGILVTHYWSKGSRLRAETVANGRRLITIVDEKDYTIIDPTNADAISIGRSELSIAGDAKRGRPFGDELEAVLRGGGEQVGTEQRNGVELARYQLTNEAGRVLLWANPEFGLPVRVERYIRATSTRENIDYINWLRDIPIDDSFFEPPKGIEIERVDYEDYVVRTMTERLGPAPPFYSHLLHGEPDDG